MPAGHPTLHTASLCHRDTRAQIPQCLGTYPSKFHISEGFMRVEEGGAEGHDSPVRQLPKCSGPWVVEMVVPSNPIHLVTRLRS